MPERLQRTRIPRLHLSRLVELFHDRPELCAEARRLLVELRTFADAVALAAADR